MAENPNIPLMDHELATDEVAWMQAVYQDFSAARLLFPKSRTPKEALRTVLGREEHRLPDQMDLTGPGPVARRPQPARPAMSPRSLLPRVELHRHARSRTDQFKPCMWLARLMRFLSR